MIRKIAANESDAIINKCNFNKSKYILFFVLLFFKESTLGSLPVYLYMSIFRTIYGHTVSKNQIVFYLMKNNISRNKQNIGFSMLFNQYNETTFRASSRIKYPFSLFFIDSIAFLFTKSFVKGSSKLSVMHS